MVSIDVFMNNTNNVESILENKKIDIKKDKNYVLLKYDIFANFSDAIVQQCRGIIYKKENNQYVCVCRPFDKFFNYQETNAVEIDWPSAKVQEKIEAEKLKRESDSFYQKLADGFDVNILLVGDGIANGSGASSPDKKWFEIVSGKIKEKYGVRAFVKNIAQWGVTSYTGFAKTAALPDDEQYDMVFVCVGQYDGASDFGVYYEGLLRALRKKYPKASLLLFLEHGQKDYTEKIKAIQEIGEHYALPIVDLVGPFKNNYENLVNDGSLYQNDGHEGYRAAGERRKRA